MRDPARLRIPIAWHVETVRGDVIGGAGSAGLGRIESPIASSIPWTAPPPALPRAGAHCRQNFAAAARAAGVGRIVYLGGPLPQSAAASRHLASRWQLSASAGCRARFRCLARLNSDWRRLRALFAFSSYASSSACLCLLCRLAALPHAAYRRPRCHRHVAAPVRVPGRWRAGFRMSVDLRYSVYGTSSNACAELMLVGASYSRPAAQRHADRRALCRRHCHRGPRLVLPLMESLGSDLLPRPMTTPQSCFRRAPALL